MKKLLLIILIAIFGIANAQNTWVQKADFGGSGRNMTVGFSIGNKGYVGTGSDGIGYTNDFWEYDPLTDVWTQKADFGGTARDGAVGFCIGNKGYIGTGEDSFNYQLSDFWEYDPLMNSWTQKADFGGTARIWAVGFSVGSKGYLGTGDDYNGTPIDFWEYDPVTDTWIQKADFPGVGRDVAVGFSIGNKGYIGTGSDYNTMESYKDFWEYDPTADTWTQKADLVGHSRYGAMGFSIGNKGYIGMGDEIAGNSPISADFWEYNPDINAWKHRESPISPYDGWAQGFGFSIGNKGYLGSGWDGGLTQMFYEYTPDSINSGCASAFTLTQDTIPHTYIVTNLAAGSPPLTYSWGWGDGNYSSGATPSHTYNAAGYYAICLTITDNAGCTDSYCDSTNYLNRNTSNSAMIYVYVISSLTEIDQPAHQDNTLIINPNPASSTIQLTFNTKHNGAVMCEIMNMVEKTVYEAPLPASPRRGEGSYAVLDVSFLAKGIYLVRVGDGEQWENRKLVVE